MRMKPKIEQLLIDGDILTVTYGITVGNATDKWDTGGGDVTIITQLTGFSDVYTNIPITTDSHSSPTTVTIEVTKSGGSQTGGVSIDIGPFSQQLTAASATLRSFQSRVYRN